MHNIFQKFKKYSLVSEKKFINNLLLVEKYKLQSGCVVECGVWKGGMIAGIAELLGNRYQYHLFDSFDGMPLASNEDGELAKKWQDDEFFRTFHNNLCVESSFVKKAMELANINNYEIHKGDFSKVFAEYKFTEDIMVLRLDSDWYESTKVCLENLYSRVIDGGIIIIDDYYSWEGCTKAIHEYIYTNNITDRIQQFNNDVAFIQKGFSSNFYTKFFDNDIK